MGISLSFQKFIDGWLFSASTSTYKIGTFTIINNGVLLEGTRSFDTLVGTTKSDIIWGNDGDDVVRAGGGRDFLAGGKGNDRLYGDDGDDRLEGWADNDQLFGGNGIDALFGGEGSDKLFGGAGNDYLCGGSSKDELYGGAGSDIFVFRPQLSSPKSESVYMDFDTSQDRVRIEDYLLPNGFSKSMIKVDADGDLIIDTYGGHRLSFENLDRSDINALYYRIDLI